MGHVGLQVCLAWAIMSVLLVAFCVWYLWHCERFRCLKYDGTRSGRFRFIMLYLYISSILTLMVFSIGFSALKYEEGLVVVGMEGKVVPNPVESWTPEHQKMLRALMVLINLSWALEIIIHLGELCRWIFLFNTMLPECLWLRSKYLHAWVLGSVIVGLYMPIVAGVSSDNVTKCEAWTFIAGSVGSLVPTLGFIPMLARFPAYIFEMEIRGMDQPTLLQLFKFQELNRARLGFRLVFIVSFFALGLDWARDVRPLIGSAFWTDLLGYLGSFGYIASSALTLAICFPRPTVPLSMSLPHTSTEKLTTYQTIGSKTTGPGTSVDQGRILEICRPSPANAPNTKAPRPLPSLPVMRVRTMRPTEPHSCIPIGELPPLVLEPNRRKVEPEEELEESTSPLSVTSQKLAQTIQSLSPKCGH